MRPKPNLIRLVVLLTIFLLGLALFYLPAHAQYLKPLTKAIDPLKEYRLCGKPKRADNGAIFRRPDVVRAYRKIHPCPSTGKHDGSCPDWAIDHIVPLASGGCDSVTNMAWMPLAIKSCSKSHCIDRWERIYYGDPYGIVDLTKP